MTDVELAAASRSEALTWPQLCERYPDQRVVLVDVDWLELRSARVAGPGATRREPLAQARPLRARYPEMAHYFTGQIRIPICGLFAP